MEKNRLEAFSDGLFAIVITLLVLEIKVPHVELYKLQEALYMLLPKFLSFMLSFIIIGVYWVAHHNMLHFIDKVDRTALWLNILVLLTVCVIPFPTALMGDYPMAMISGNIYGITLAFVNLAGTLFWIYCTRNNRLAVKNLHPRFARRVAYLHAAPIALYLVAIAASLVSIWISYTIYIAIPMFFIFPNPFLDKMFRDIYLAE